MKTIKQQFTVPFTYSVEFTENLFDSSNSLFADTIKDEHSALKPSVLFVFDSGMFSHHPDLMKDISSYASAFSNQFSLIPEPVIIPGGERAKNDPNNVQMILDAIESADLDRHSYVAVIGGGAVTDTAGYAAAIAHRGIRLIRIPTTVLAQNDAAVGVKNGVNAYGKKNFLGTFVPPVAVLNDFSFLKTLDDRQWRAGISEAVKVALIKDEQFFEELEENADALNGRDKEAMSSLIYRCAELHLEHISTSGDPFERGSSRPLDFGHWIAHKLEQLTDYKLLHGEAVAIGIVVDTIYSQLKGYISEDECNRIIQLFRNCGFTLFVPELESNLDDPLDKKSVLHGLQEFREHLGGELTIMLLDTIGKGVEVHEADMSLYRKAIDELRTREKELV
jgi:3-dehydroquinate synthase